MTTAPIVRCERCLKPIDGEPHFDGPPFEPGVIADRVPVHPACCSCGETEQSAELETVAPVSSPLSSKERDQ